MRRLERVELMLPNTQLPLAEIAAAMGLAAQPPYTPFPPSDWCRP
jgi:hypothetical protein